MERHFEKELRQIKRQILEMGGLAESMIQDSIESLVKQNEEAAFRALRSEERMNMLQNTLDELCLKALALRQPLAGDLRFLVAVLKMTADLERIGDNAVNIVEAARRLMKEPPIKPYVDLPRMATRVANMTHTALDGLVRWDDKLAMTVTMADDEVDNLRNQIFRELLTHMMADPTKIPSCLQLILISRFYERIGDHATNIAEEVIYMVSGKDVRHHQHDEWVQTQTEGKPAPDLGPDNAGEMDASAEQ